MTNTVLFGNDAGDEPPEQVTVGYLRAMLESLDPELVVVLSIGPEYDEGVLTSAIVIADHGCLFLVAEKEEEDEDENETAVLEAEYSEVPQIDKPESVPDGAEEA